MQDLQRSKQDLAKHVMAMVKIIHQQDNLIDSLRPDLVPYISSTLSMPSAAANQVRSATVHACNAALLQNTQQCDAAVPNAGMAGKACCQNGAGDMCSVFHLQVNPSFLPPPPNSVTKTRNVLFWQFANCAAADWLALRSKFLHCRCCRDTGMEMPPLRLHTKMMLCRAALNR